MGIIAQPTWPTQRTGCLTLLSFHYLEQKKIHRDSIRRELKEKVTGKEWGTAKIPRNLALNWTITCDWIVGHLCALWASLFERGLGFDLHADCISQTFKFTEHKFLIQREVDSNHTLGRVSRNLPLVYVPTPLNSPKASTFSCKSYEIVLFLLPINVPSKRQTLDHFVTVLLGGTKCYFLHFLVGSSKLSVSCFRIIFILGIRECLAY